ncbi:MAG: hypothetical protein Unbinned4388contig1000_46 [Prokaryotic dsDNA virus sp.]|nr:MAG: hypothetical protein Unbinned4388contig1000_46 [Prokaryotic dsDNA virus sp.]|tara:strand:- start:62005 stop:62247 length:243 start_codon:yes stop_codon:yes gene_type:complete
MKITRERNGSFVNSFIDVAVGEVFQFADGIYLKLYEFGNYESDEPTNAVDLINNKVCRFDDDITGDEYIILESELIIKNK